jgi:hypothetical protein
MPKMKIGHRLASAMIGIAMLAGPALVAQGGPVILKPADMAKILPATVFYCGQSATTQVRNSGGVKFADGHFVLASLVDTSGYSSGIAAKYQAYFIVEEPIRIAGQSLPAGVYGIGFVAGNQFVVTDIGGHDVFTASSTHDDAIARPRPLLVTADPAGGFRLYAGRNFVVFSH